MSPSELEAMRRLIFYSIEDAARFLASSPDRPEGVEPRSWQAWERGRRIPADVVAATEQAVIRRAAMVARYESCVLSMLPALETVGLAWFSTQQDWLAAIPGVQPRDAADWRLHCSALAEVRARRPDVRLVPFDSDSYTSWVNSGQRGAGLAEDLTLPDHWATSVGVLAWNVIASR